MAVLDVGGGSGGGWRWYVGCGHGADVSFANVHLRVPFEECDVSLKLSELCLHTLLLLLFWNRVHNH